MARSSKPKLLSRPTLFKPRPPLVIPDIVATRTIKIVMAGRSDVPVEDLVKTILHLYKRNSDQAFVITGFQDAFKGKRK